MLDRERLAKILALTTSEHDGEALSAIRKANEIIKGEKLTWDEVLVQVTGTVINIRASRYPANGDQYEPTESWTPPHLTDAPVIEMMFRTIYSTPIDGTEFGKFIGGVYAWWQKNKVLTPKQYQAVRTAYNRASR